MGNIFSKNTTSLGKRRADEEDTIGSGKRVRIDNEGSSNSVTSDTLDPTLATELSEADVGVLAYLTPNLSPFHAILKYRAEDFIVHEVDLDGETVHLTTTDSPDIDTRGDALEPPEFDKRVEAIFDADVASQLRDLLDHPDSKTRSLHIPSSREQRGSFYRLLRIHSDVGLQASSDMSSLTVSWAEKNENGSKNEEESGGKRKEPKHQECVDFDALGGEYLQFNMQKSGFDTMSAVNLICRLSNIPSKHIRFAGTKDSRAVTVQMLTAHKILPDSFLRIKEKLADHSIYLGDFKFVNQGLTMGDLSGNRFTIVLRNISGGTQKKITKSLEALQNNGFINYFGMQRFGVGAVGTHEIGRALLQRNYSEAVNLLLMPRPGEREDYAQARAIWADTGNAALAREAFPIRAQAERIILGCFASGIKDPRVAIGRIPRHQLTLYYHAYQSYVWNRAVSERVTRYGGTKPLVGDLVLVKNEPSTTFSGDAVGRRDPFARKIPKVLGKDDVDKYTIFDVVYPMPGSRTVYPDNALHDFYVHLMEEDGIPIKARPWKVNLLNKSLPGDYRPILTKPGELTWSFVRYDDPTIQLCCTDLEKLKDLANPTGVKDGKWLSLRLEFTLSPGQFATSALRELMRQSTASRVQSRLVHAT